MPEVLKVLLVDDWQAVTKHNQVGKIFYSFQPPTSFFSPLFFLQLVTLPRSPNVVELLAEFAEYIKTTKPPQFVQLLPEKTLNLTFFVHHQSERTSSNDSNRRLRTSNLL